MADLESSLKVIKNQKRVRMSNEIGHSKHCLKSRTKKAQVGAGVSIGSADLLSYQPMLCTHIQEKNARHKESYLHWRNARWKENCYFCWSTQTDEPWFLFLFCQWNDHVNRYFVSKQIPTSLIIPVLKTHTVTPGKKRFLSIKKSCENLKLR